jgi:hypothetical protein
MTRLTLLSVLFLFIKVASADGFTPSERAATAKIRTAIETQCNQEIDLKLRQQQPDNAPAISRWLTNYLTASPPSEFCACASQGVERLLTPSMLRSGTQQELAGLVRLSGAQCALPKLKSSFPSFCHDMLGEAVGHPIKSSKARTAASKFCECVQIEINSVTAENFESFTAATMKDSQAFRSTRQIPTDSTSLLGGIKRCGGEKLGKELHDDM